MARTTCILAFLCSTVSGYHVGGIQLPLVKQNRATDSRAGILVWKRVFMNVENLCS